MLDLSVVSKVSILCWGWRQTGCPVHPATGRPTCLSGDTSAQTTLQGWCWLCRHELLLCWDPFILHPRGLFNLQNSHSCLFITSRIHIHSCLFYNPQNSHSFMSFYNLQNSHSFMSFSLIIQNTPEGFMQNTSDAWPSLTKQTRINSKRGFVCLGVFVCFFQIIMGFLHSQAIANLNFKSFPGK